MPTQITLSTGGTLNVSQSPLEVREAISRAGGEPVQFSDIHGDEIYVNPGAIVSWEGHNGGADGR